MTHDGLENDGRARGHRDRRVRRTRGRLRAALGSLLHERPYEDIAVKQILARADVGRSTFYAHFADKDALLASAVRDLLHAPPRVGDRDAPSGRAGGADEVLRFSRPVFAHIERHRRAGGAMADPRARAGVHAHLERVLADRVAADVRRAARPRGQSQPGEYPALPVPPDLLARHVVSTFLLVLDWWAARAEPCSAAEADAQFRALVLPAVRAALD